MNLNGLTKRVEIYDGQVAFHFLPFATLKTRIMLADFEKAITEAGRDYAANERGYINATHAISQVEKLTDTPDYRARCLLYWWENRSLDLVADYDPWVAVMADDARTELFQAWIKNLETLPAAKEALHEGRPDPVQDPESSSAGGKRGKKKSPR